MKWAKLQGQKMTLKLYSWDLSPYSARERMQIYAKGLTDIAIEQAPTVLTQTFHADHPIGRIALLEIDGEAMPESDVIARFGRGAIRAIALCGLAAASVAVLPTVIGAAKAESVTRQTHRVFELRVNHALPGKTPALAQAPAGRSFRDCSNGCPEMVVAPQGSFTMGAPAGEEARENLPDPWRGRSAPQHLVTFRHRFAIGKFDVTQDEYAQFVAETHRPYPDSCTAVAASGGFIATNGYWRSPGFPQTGRDPVVCVGWDDAQAYVSWLSAKTGHVYRLPTEAEWEYAARAGTTTARYFSDNRAEVCRHTNVGDLDYGEQHPGDSGGTPLACHDGYAFTSPVGRFPPNRFGLYDMLGDVMDWTEDCWNINYSGAPTDGTAWLTGDCSRRVVHGGSWDMDLRAVRSAMRRGLLTPTRSTTLGFRVARTL